MRRTAPSPAAGRVDRRRRAFLQAGAAGSALLLAGRWLARARAAPAAAEGVALRHLTGADALMLRRLVPVVLDGALPGDSGQRASAVTEVLAGIDLAIHYQSPAARRQIADLFGLLTSGVTRALVAGVWSAWDEASTEDVRAFLSRWRDSRFALLRSAYLGLTQLIVGSWYGNPRAWPRIGYPGPPRLA